MPFSVGMPVEMFFYWASLCGIQIEVKDKVKIFLSNNRVLFVFKVTSAWQTRSGKASWVIRSKV